MKTFVAIVLVAGSGALLAPPANAVCARTEGGVVEVSPGSCTGFGHDGRGKCSFVSIADSTREPGWQKGHVWAGPLAVLEAGTLICSIHVNNNSHNGAAYVTESATSEDGVVVMEPREMSYPATEQDTVSMCTTWAGAGGTLYWRDPNPVVPTDTGSWSAAPSSCGEALHY